MYEVCPECNELCACTGEGARSEELSALKTKVARLLKALEEVADCYYENYDYRDARDVAISAMRDEGDGYDYKSADREVAGG